MTDISVQNVKIAFVKGVNVLDGISFEIYEGEHVGLLGRNGAGKTTLFRLITGELDSDEGNIVIAPGKRVGVLSQIPVYPAGSTAEDVLKTAHRRVYAMGRKMQELEEKMAAGHQDRDTLQQYDHISSEFLRLGGYELDRFRDTVANGLGIPKSQREQLFSELSGGEKTRINLARLILEDTDILLLDEPTNHLDMSATEWLEDYISKFRGTVLAISHDRFFLDKAVTRIVEVQDGKAEFYSGSYSFYVEEKRRRYQEKLRQYEKEQAKVEQLKRAAADLHLWAFMGNDKLHKRAFSIEKRIEKLQTTDRPTAERRMRAKFGETDFHGDEVLLVKGVSKAFGEKKLFSDVNLLVRAGERIALIGDNGTGKSTFIHMIMGEEPTDTGLMRLGPTVKTAYLPQIIEFEDPYLDVLETMMYEGKCQMQEARDRLGAYLFRDKEVFTCVSELSGGERSRLKLCMIMKNDVNLLILDEPTNHLDIASREWIEDAVGDYGEALLFVSHDRYFINKFATRIWEVKDGKITDYNCGFERYRQLKELEAINAPQQPAKVVEKKEKPAPKERKMSPSTRERLVKKLEREIADLEARMDENQKLQEQHYSDYEKLMELSTELAEMTEQLEEKYAQWEELAE